MKFSVLHWFRKKWNLRRDRLSNEALNPDQVVVQDFVLPEVLTDKFKDIVSLSDPDDVTSEFHMDLEPNGDNKSVNSNIDFITTQQSQALEKADPVGQVDSEPIDENLMANIDSNPILTGDIQLERKIHFFIEQLDELDFHFYIGGWIFSESYDITGLTVLVSSDNEERYSEVYYGIERYDVFDHYNIKNAQRSGFIDSIEKSFDGPVHISLVITLSDGYKVLIKLGEFQFRRSFLQPYNKLIQHNRHAYFAANALNKFDRKKIAVYSKIGGNYFFSEIKALLIRALELLEYTVLNLDESGGFNNDAFIHIIIAPHEFYAHGISKNYYFKPSKRLILFNTEQISKEWLQVKNSYFAQAIEIWDMNFNSQQRLNQAVDYVRYLPVGYVPNFKLLGEITRLPDNYYTCFLAEKIKDNSFLNADFEDRPIDILFIGHTSWRRQQFLAENASFFTRYNCIFHLTNLSNGPGRDTMASIDLNTVIGLAQRSKIILNIHHGIHPYFEWHRMVTHGIWQKSLIVTEWCTEAPPFVAGIDFIQAPLEDITRKIEYYLESEAGKKGAKNIIDSAFIKLTTNGDFVTAINRQIDSLEALLIDPQALPDDPEASIMVSPINEPIEIIFEQKSVEQVDITVIITLYNYADLIVETLHSLLQQTHKTFNLVIVEDCSTDTSLLVAENWLKEHHGFFNCIQLLHNKENRGLGVSRNIAYRFSMSPYVFVLDADNIIFPRALEKLWSGLKNTDAAFAYSYLEHFGDRERLGGLCQWNPGLLSFGNIIDAMVLMRKQTWERIGGYAEDMPSNGMEDYEILFKIAEAGDWALRIPEILCRYRVHDRSMLKNETNNKRDEIVEYLQKKYPNFWAPSHLKQLRQTEMVLEEFKN